MNSQWDVTYTSGGVYSVTTHAATTTNTLSGTVFTADNFTPLPTPPKFGSIAEANAWMEAHYPREAAGE